MANARRRTQRTSSRSAARVAARTAGDVAGGALEADEGGMASKVDWQKEMFYINKDLRELLIISVALFAVLFIVGFFL
jgi:hypothetical protein